MIRLVLLFFSKYKKRDFLSCFTHSLEHHTHNTAKSSFCSLDVHVCKTTFGDYRHMAARLNTPLTLSGRESPIDPKWLFFDTTSWWFRGLGAYQSSNVAINNNPWLANYAPLFLTWKLHFWGILLRYSSWVDDDDYGSIRGTDTSSIIMPRITSPTWTATHY